MKIPILDLVRQYESIRSEMDDAILDVVRSGKYILGSRVREFEEEAAGYCGAKHAVGVASGTDALLLSLKALGIGPGDKVILPSFTFFATAGVVHHVGATPVFCDIDPKTFNIDPEHLRSILEGAGAASGKWSVASGGSKSVASNSAPVGAAGSQPDVVPPRATYHKPNTAFKAIIPVHLYGQIANMDEILAIAKEFNLAVIEDAAQSIGAQYWGSRASDPGPRNEDHGPKKLHEPHEPNELHEPKKAGTLGDLGCFSFYPTKNLGAYGDGGMITTNNDELADKVRLLRVHGAEPKYFHKLVGINSRLDAIQAVVLGVKLPHLDQWSAARSAVADRYDRELQGVKGIVTPYRAPSRTHVFHQYTIRVLDGKRVALASHLKAKGIGTMIYYPQPLHLQECFAFLGYKEGELPESERASNEVLSLPIFPELTLEEQAYVVQTVRAFFKGGKAT